MNTAIPHPEVVTPPDAREQFESHRRVCNVCGPGPGLCRIGMALSDRMHKEAAEAAKPQISADARYIARTIVRAMIWIWVVLPIVAWIIYKIASA